MVEQTTMKLDLALRIPAGEYELTQREIDIFLIFRYLRYFLIGETTLEEADIDLGQEFKQLCPESESAEWKVGAEYEFDNKTLIPAFLQGSSPKAPRVDW